MKSANTYLAEIHIYVCLSLSCSNSDNNGYIATYLRVYGKTSP